MFTLQCEFCLNPVKMTAQRYAVMFDAGRLPTCGECRRYKDYLEEVRCPKQSNVPIVESLDYSVGRKSC